MRVWLCTAVGLFFVIKRRTFMHKAWLQVVFRGLMPLFLCGMGKNTGALFRSVALGLGGGVVASLLAAENVDTSYTQQLLSVGNVVENNAAFNSALSDIINSVGVFAKDDVSLGMLEAFVPGLSNQETLNTTLPQMAEVLKPRGIYIGGILNDQVVEFFRIFSVALFFLTLSISSYGLVAAVLDSALDGNPMGRNVGNRYFLGFKTVVSLAAFFPLPPTGSQGYVAGFSLAQSAVHAIAVLGVYLANTLWAIIVAVMLTFKGGVGELMLRAAGAQMPFYTSPAAEDTAVNPLQDFENILKTQIKSLNAPESFDNPVTSMLASLLCARLKSERSLEIGSGMFQTNDNALTLNLLPGGDTSCGTFSVRIPTVENNPERQSLVEQTIKSNVLALVRALSSAMEQIPTSLWPQEVCTADDGTAPKQGRCYDALKALNGNAGYLQQAGRFARLRASVEQALTNYFRFQILLIPLYVPSQQAPGDAVSPVEMMLRGGWAVASNHYLYFSPLLGNVQYSFNADAIETNLVSARMGNFCQSSSQNRMICAFLLNPSGKNYALRLGLPEDIASLTTGNISAPAVDTPSAGDCASNPENCTTLMSQMGKDKAGQFRVGVAVRQMLAKYNQITLENPAKTFKALAEQNTVCQMPFGGGLCPKSDGLLGAVESSTKGAFLRLGIFMGAFVPFMSTSSPLIWKYKNSLRWVGLYNTIYNPFTTPLNSGVNLGSVIRVGPPKSLQEAVYALTYTLSKTWYDCFIKNRKMLFLDPIHTLSEFGFSVLQTTTAFFIRTGIDTYAQNFATAIEFFMKRLEFNMVNSMLLETALRITQLGEYLEKGATAGAPKTLVETFPLQAEFDIWREGIGDPFFGELVATNLPNIATIAQFALSGISVIFSFNPFTAPVGRVLGTVQKVIANVMKFSSITLSTAGKLSTVAINLAIAPQLSSYSDYNLAVLFWINTMWAPVYLAICVPFMVIGALFAYFLPMFPNLLYGFVVFGWLLFYFEAVMATPLILIGLSNPKGHPLLGNMQKLMMMLLGLVLKPALIVLGFLGSTIVASAAIWIFYAVGFPFLEMRLESFVAEFAQRGSSSDVLIPCVLILMVMMYVYMMFQMLLYAYALTYQVPNTVMRWIGLQPDQGEEANVSREISEQFKNISKQLAGSGKDTSKGAGDAGGQVAQQTRGR